MKVACTNCANRIRYITTVRTRNYCKAKDIWLRNRKVEQLRKCALYKESPGV